MSATRPPPLTGIRVVELAGLAPVPFTSMILADYGASVIRIDRPVAGAHPSSFSSPLSSSSSQDPESNPSSPSASRSRQPKPTAELKSQHPQPKPTADLLTRHKSSLCISLKSPRGRQLLLSILKHADVLLDPYRPGVLEKLDLSPTTLHATNPRLIIARLSGFRRDGKYSAMAGHDINYVAASGVLSMLGRSSLDPGYTSNPTSSDTKNQPKEEQREQYKPYAPGNLLADFAGGALGCTIGILLALHARDTDPSHAGQVVHSNMVDGTAYLATFLRFARKNPMWNDRRGNNILDGGAPYYDTYRTRCGGYLSVGALEPQFYGVLLEKLGLEEEGLPGGVGGRFDKRNWTALREVFEGKFLEKDRKEWETIFDGTDACVVPVLEQGELERDGYEQRGLVELSGSPGLVVGEGGHGEGAWYSRGMRPGDGGVRRLEE